MDELIIPFRIIGFNNGATLTGEIVATDENDDGVIVRSEVNDAETFFSFSGNDFSDSLTDPNRPPDPSTEAVGPFTVDGSAILSDEELDMRGGDNPNFKFNIILDPPGLGDRTIFLRGIFVESLFQSPDGPRQYQIQQRFEPIPPGQVVTGDQGNISVSIDSPMALVTVDFALDPDIPTNQIIGDPRNPPIANPDTAETDENTPLAIPTANLLVNDIDPLNNGLVVTSVDGSATTGLVSLDGTTVNYDPNGQFDSLGQGDTATDTFTYTINDVLGRASTSTVTVTIDGVNNRPVLEDIEVETLDTAEFAFSAMIFEDAFSDVDENDVLTAINVLSLPAVGSLLLNGAAIVAGQNIPTVQLDNLTYLPIVGDTGSFDFEVTAEDQVGGESGTSDPATVTVEVLPDGPPAVPPSFELNGVPLLLSIQVPDVTIEGLATVDPGTSSPESLAFEVTAAPDLFSAGPAIDAQTGDLTLMLDGTTGTSLLTAILSGDSGTSGEDTFETEVISGAAAARFTEGQTPDVPLPGVAGSVVYQVADNVASLSLLLGANVTAIASFDNLVGLFEVVDVNGGIDTNGDGIADLNPGDAGYAQTAIEGRISEFEIRGGSRVNTAAADINPELADVVLNGGSFFVPFIVANAGPFGIDGFVNRELDEGGIFNNPSEFFGDQVAYFPFVAANPDGAEHLLSYGNNVFGFEDLPGGGDNDFNDLIFQLEFVAV